jgi:glycerol-3-phosphate acyltransferase PlsY
MVWEHVTRWAVVPAGLFDVLKASLPAWLSLQRDLGPWVAAGAGLAAAIGHNWPLFLGFTGGRAVSCFLGIWLVLFPWGFPWMLAFLTVGYLLGDSAPWTLASLVTLPLLSHLVDGPAVVRPAAGAMLLLTFVKRVEANRRPLPSAGPERRRVLLRRLFLDRDIASHRDWIRRQPDGEDQAGAGR